MSYFVSMIKVIGWKGIIDFHLVKMKPVCLWFVTCLAIAALEQNGKVVETTKPVIFIYTNSNAIQDLVCIIYHLMMLIINNNSFSFHVALCNKLSLCKNATCKKCLVSQNLIFYI